MKDLIDRKKLLEAIAENGSMDNNVRLIIQQPQANKEMTFCDMLRLESAYRGWIDASELGDDFINILRFLKEVEVIN